MAGQRKAKAKELLPFGREGWGTVTAGELRDILKDFDDGFDIVFDLGDGSTLDLQQIEVKRAGPACTAGHVTVQMRSYIRFDLAVRKDDE